MDARVGQKTRRILRGLLVATVLVAMVGGIAWWLFGIALDRIVERSTQSRELCVAEALRDNEELLRVARDLFPRGSIGRVEKFDSCDSAEGGGVDIDVYTPTYKEALKGFYDAGWSSVPTGAQACEGYRCIRGVMKSVDARIIYVLVTDEAPGKIEALLVYW
ncbi:hypothetical protein [Nonomuraea dietziae]|uniref:hypothetical protein n=1 Tax=Nonomuraea dietziae TaxID=65515 RepID=UPI0033C01231